MTVLATLETTKLRVALAESDQLDAALADRWNALAGDVPFRTFAWCECWWRHYRQPGWQLWTLIVRDEDDEIIAIAPWYLESSRSRGAVVRFLGSGEICSDYLSLLTLDDHALAAGQAVADWLAGEGAGSWDLLDLSGCGAADPAIIALGDRLADHGCLVDRQPDLACWRTELPDDWNAFLGSLSKSRRERTRSLLRRALDTGRVAVHRVATDEQLDAAFDVLVDLHQKRRRSLDQSGCFASASFGAFHREVARKLLAEGALRMFWTELDGRPLAVEYSFVGGTTIYYYQGGFEPELADERPGWLSFAISLKLAIDEGYQAFDFLRGDEAYKASWGAVARPLVRVRVAGRPAAARLRLQAWRACQSVKSWTRSVLTHLKRKPRCSQPR